MLAIMMSQMNIITNSFRLAEIVDSGFIWMLALDYTKCLILTPAGTTKLMLKFWRCLWWIIQMNEIIKSE